MHPCNASLFLSCFPPALALHGISCQAELVDVPGVLQIVPGAVLHDALLVVRRDV